MANHEDLPEGLIGWDADIDGGGLLTNPSQVRVKLIATSDGVRAYVLSGDPELARELRRAGFAPAEIRRTLCG
ncbi:MAG: hypothetical protein ABSH56_32800 [Bryobacteraceae bacterium]|jgi:hypothetical protein